MSEQQLHRSKVLLADGGLADRIGQLQSPWGGQAASLSPDLQGALTFVFGMAVLDLKGSGVYEPGTFTLQIGKALTEYRNTFDESGLSQPSFLPRRPWSCCMGMGR